MTSHQRRCDSNDRRSRRTSCRLRRPWSRMRSDLDSRGRHRGRIDLQVPVAHETLSTPHPSHGGRSRYRCRHSVTPIDESARWHSSSWRMLRVRDHRDARGAAETSRHSRLRARVYCCPRATSVADCRRSVVRRISRTGVQGRRRTIQTMTRMRMKGVVIRVRSDDHWSWHLLAHSSGVRVTADGMTRSGARLDARMTPMEPCRWRWVDKLLKWVATCHR